METWIIHVKHLTVAKQQTRNDDELNVTKVTLASVVVFIISSANR